MPVTVKGSGGGGVTLDAGAAASATTLTLPNVSGTVLQSGTAVTVAQGGTGATSLTANNVLLGNGTSALQVVAPGANGNVLTSNGTTWTSSAPSTGAATAIGQVPFSTDGSTFTATQKIVQGTSVASTSGTSIDFTSIPSWVKRITVMIDGISTNGSSPVQIQIGSGSVSATGYTNAASYGGSGNTSYSTTGFSIIASGTMGAAYNYSGLTTLALLGSNIWCETGTMANGSSVAASYSAGSKTLSGALDRVRITTVNGTDTFDAGTINLLWE